MYSMILTYCNAIYISYIVTVCNAIWMCLKMEESSKCPLSPLHFQVPYFRQSMYTSTTYTLIW